MVVSVSESYVIRGGVRRGFVASSAGQGVPTNLAAAAGNGQVALTWTAPTPVSRADNFNRADSTTTLGTPSDGGSGWTIVQGTWGISSNQAYSVTYADGDRAVLELGQADATASVVIYNPGTGKWPGLISRNGSGNGYIVEVVQGTGTLELYRVVGAATTLLSSASPGFASGATLSLTQRITGSAVELTVRINGTQIILYTDSNVARVSDATKFGFRTGLLTPATPALRFDSFSAVHSGSSVTDYTVQYKLSSSGTWLTFSHAASPATTQTVTGLTNNQFYDFRVASVVGGVTGTYTSPVTAVPTAVVTGVVTIFGYNTADSGATLSSRTARFGGRAPCVRRSIDTFLTSSSFPITTAVAPEKRVSYSFKTSAAPYNASGLAAGSGNDRLMSWCQSIPANWTVYLTYFPEPGSAIRGGTLTVANYLNAYQQFRNAIDSATLNTGVNVKLVSNFSGHRVSTSGYFSDTWVPPLGVADIMTFNVLGDPGELTSQLLTSTCAFDEGAEYRASLPDVPTRFYHVFQAIERNGFQDHWGLLELNTPPRDWDGPTNLSYVCGPERRLRYQGGRTAAGHDSSHTEVERSAWLKAASEICLEPPMTNRTAAEIVLYWEHRQDPDWDYAWYDDRVWTTVAPYIEGTPVGGV